MEEIAKFRTDKNVFTVFTNESKILIQNGSSNKINLLYNNEKEGFRIINKYDYYVVDVDGFFSEIDMVREIIADLTSIIRKIKK